MKATCAPPPTRVSLTINLPPTRVTCRSSRICSSNAKSTSPKPAPACAANYPRKIPCCTRSGILPGRRNNGDREQGIPPLCCFAPIHYVELPELFMDFILASPANPPAPPVLDRRRHDHLQCPPTHPRSQYRARRLRHHRPGRICHLRRTRWAPLQGGSRHLAANPRDLESFPFWRKPSRTHDLPRLSGTPRRLSTFRPNHRRRRLGYRITQRFAHEYFGRIFHDRIPCFPKTCFGPNCRMPNSTPRASPPSPTPNDVLPRPTSVTAPPPLLARPCAPCSRSWRRTT